MSSRKMERVETNMRTIRAIEESMSEIYDEGFSEKLLDIDAMQSLWKLTAEDIKERTGWFYGSSVADCSFGVQPHMNPFYMKKPRPKWLDVSKTRLNAEIELNDIPVIDHEPIHYCKFKSRNKKHPYIGFCHDLLVTDTAVVRGLGRLDKPMWVKDAKL